jgi:hypothetical protein
MTYYSEKIDRKDAVRERVKNISINSTIGAQKNIFQR